MVAGQVWTPFLEYNRFLISRNRVTQAKPSAQTLLQRPPVAVGCEAG